MKTMALTTILLMLSLSALADTTTYVCDYKTFSDNEDGLQEVDSPFVLIFVVDNENGKAAIVGNSWSEEVTIIANDGGGLTFVEITVSGNVMTTTCDSSGKSVHSRNSVLLGELIPSQFYGRCE